MSDGLSIVQRPVAATNLSNCIISMDERRYSLRSSPARARYDPIFDWAPHPQERNLHAVSWSPCS
ncbi:MAG: hypothetical protein A4E38_00162 [Methanoregulaceae archaeon PtaB.Bin108]|nr:MAG: hypothetical protein A4E38_00162 [Methanoregulaceae archaeon PtaB.Bin108]